MEALETIVNSKMPLTIVTKLFILDVCGGTGHAVVTGVRQNSFSKTFPKVFMKSWNSAKKRTETMFKVNNRNSRTRC